MAQSGQPVSRQAANAILQAMIKDKLLDETAWVRVVGALTEAEVMAMRFDDQCLGAAGGGLEPAVISGAGLVGENRFYGVDWSDGEGRSSMVLPIPVARIRESAGRIDAAAPAKAAPQQYGVAAAGTFMNGYEIKCGLSSDDVALWISDRMAASAALSVAPDLDPTAPTNNLATGELPRSRAGALQYLDFTQSSTIGRPGQESKAGAVIAVLASLDSNLTRRGIFEYLTFGALTSITKTGLTTTSLVTVSDALAASSNKIPVDRLTTHMALTSIDQTCVPSSVPVAAFDLNRMIDVTQQATVSGYTVASSDRPFAWAARRNGAAMSHCRIKVKGLGSTRRGNDGANLTQTAAEDIHQSLQYLNGAQVCRIVVRNFKSRTDLASLGSAMPQRPDFVAAAQVVRRAGQTYRVRCLDSSVMIDAAEQLQLDSSIRTEPRPLLSMGLLSQWWDGNTAANRGGVTGGPSNGWVQVQLGVANSGGLVADGSASYPSWTDLDGPQQYSTYAVRVEVWELVVGVVLVVMTTTFDFTLPRLYDTVITQLFLYPHLRRTQERVNAKRAPFTEAAKDDDRHSDHAVFVEDLTFRATMVLVEYPAGMNPAAAVSTRPGTRPPASFDVQFSTSQSGHCTLAKPTMSTHTDVPLSRHHSSSPDLDQDDEVDVDGDFAATMAMLTVDVDPDDAVIPMLVPPLRPDEPRKAWVTLLTSDAYADGALVLATSLRAVGTQYPIMVMHTPHVRAHTRTRLAAAFDRVIPVGPIFVDDPRLALLNGRPELRTSFTKLRAWTLTQFEKLVFLDADTLVVQNLDDLMDRPELSAAPDAGWPDMFNSGVFTLVPSIDTYRALRAHLREHGSIDGGDQGLLNAFFGEAWRVDPARRLPFTDNMTPTANYMYLPALRAFASSVRVLHFIGRIKPWHCFCSADGSALHAPHGLAEEVKDLMRRWWAVHAVLVAGERPRREAGRGGRRRWSVTSVLSPVAPPSRRGSMASITSTVTRATDVIPFSYNPAPEESPMELVAEPEDIDDDGGASASQPRDECHRVAPPPPHEPQVHQGENDATAFTVPSPAPFAAPTSSSAVVPPPQQHLESSDSEADRHEQHQVLAAMLISSAAVSLPASSGPGTPTPFAYSESGAPTPTADWSAATPFAASTVTATPRPSSIIVPRSTGPYAWPDAEFDADFRTTIEGTNKLHAPKSPTMPRSRAASPWGWGPQGDAHASDDDDNEQTHTSDDESDDDTRPPLRLRAASVNSASASPPLAAASPTLTRTASAVSLTGASNTFGLDDSDDDTQRMVLTWLLRTHGAGVPRGPGAGIGASPATTMSSVSSSRPPEVDADEDEDEESEDEAFRPPVVLKRSASGVSLTSLRRARIASAASLRELAAANAGSAAASPVLGAPALVVVPQPAEAVVEKSVEDVMAVAAAPVAADEMVAPGTARMDVDSEDEDDDDDDPFEFTVKARAPATAVATSSAARF
ncbi:Glycogenin-1 [Allomyces javanicus]|nr:Glycogenin-1 [Allomyces javanicus]